MLEQAQTFNGYRGYVYPNGKVIFEKFYRSTKNGPKAAYNESIIVMDLADFIEMAPQSKTELMNLIRSQQAKSVQRIYHTSGWQKRVMAVIQKDILEYDFNVIEELLQGISNTCEEEKIYKKGNL